VNAPIGVAGAGTMGAGIAELACLAGFETLLHDPDPEALARGCERLHAGLERAVERGRASDQEAGRAAARLVAAPKLDDLASCGLVIEAAPEDLALKRSIFARLESVCAPGAALATNTSSLPVTEIAAEAARPERVCGMHFFNPPTRMTLVELVAGDRTGEPALAAAAGVAERMGRTVIRCSDSPGFIVNRCNRPFALESLRILEARIATADEIDRAIRELGGYPMGPFELIDLIGVDVNLEVARSFYRQRPEPRWQPSPLQAEMVAAGRLGRKAGRGFYDYDAGAEPASSEPGELDPALARRVLERVVAQLVNEACFAAEEGVAAPAEIDLAMRLGLNHPRGPFEWARELGAERVEETLDALHAENDQRYRVAPYLRRLTDPGQPS
jgi:3-hydroxybutyryl-CoA dehydrogenase